MYDFIAKQVNLCMMSGMILHAVFLILGFSALFFGADILVKGSATLAKQTGIRPVIIALTIIAFGTSAPELFVSVNASLHHSPDISVGNILGSMIANIGLILGISALINPIKVKFRLLKKEAPILIVCELIFLAMAWNLTISRFEGAILFALFILFNWYCVREAIRNIKQEKENVQKEYEEYVSKKERSKLLNISFIVIGLVCLIAGSHFSIKGATFIANVFRISPFIIAASVIAFGTSLPELATSAVAAARGEFDISVGNILGSNIFNILMCIGLAAMIAPLSVEKNIVTHDTLVMVALSIILCIFMWTRLIISRLEGLFLILIYGGYLVYLFY